MPKAGSYKLVLWVRSGPVKNVVFGEVVDLTLDLAAFGVTDEVDAKIK